MFFQKDKKGPEADPTAIALLPLRDLVVFPYMVVPLIVGRKSSIKALEEASENGEKRILLATQRAASVEDPSEDDIFDTGTVANIIQMLRLPDGTVKVLVEGKHRAKIHRFVANEDFFQVEVEALDEPEVDPIACA